MISWHLDDLGETANSRWTLFELRDQLLAEFPTSKVASDLRDWCDRMQQLERDCLQFRDVIEALERANDDTSSTQRRDALVRVVDDYTNRVTPFRDLMSWAPKLPAPSNFVVTEEMIEPQGLSLDGIQQLLEKQWAIQWHRLDNQLMYLAIKAYGHPRREEVSKKLATGKLDFRQACINLNIEVPLSADTPEGEKR